MSSQASGAHRCLFNPHPAVPAVAAREPRALVGAGGIPASRPGGADVGAFPAERSGAGGSVTVRHCAPALL